MQTDPEDQQSAPGSLGPSIRRRLPLLISALLAGVAVAFLWAAYRTVEKTLVRAGGDRAHAAGEELAGRLSAGTANALTQNQTLAKQPVLQQLLRNPTDEVHQAARNVLVPPTAKPGLRRVEVWSADGSLVLEIASGRDEPPDRLKAYPRGDSSVRAGISPLKASGEFPFFEMTTEIPDTSSPSAAPLGYLRRFGELTATGPVRRLLGDQAQLKVGTPGGLWTDFSGVIEAPPADDLRRGPGEFRDAGGGRWVGVLSQIEGAPWSVWVGYPYSVVVAPTRAFLNQMMIISAIVVIVGVFLARSLASRITGPLSALGDASQAVAAGNLGTRVAVDRTRELGQLARTFNAMTARLERDQIGRTAAEEALRDREASFRALFASNPLPMWVYDATSLRFLEVNDAAEQRYGYSREEFLGMRILDIRPPEDLPRLMTQISGERKPIQHGAGWRHRLKSGEVIEVEITSHTLTHAGRPAVLVVAQDVTERRQLEAQFLQAQKMEAIGQLTGGIAHDFNNLLTGILGYSELVLESLEPTDSRRDDVEEIRKAGRSAESLIARLLAFSRRQITEPRVININATVSELSRILGRTVGEDIMIELHLDPELGHVIADPGQVEQTLLNLVVNARDAMPAGGRLTIETDNVTLGEEYSATHLATVPGDYVMLAVSDTGTGIPPEVQAHLFEPFFTTKEAGKGTGLGLASVYGIVKQSNGSIGVYSEPGHGTTFKIYLPRVVEPLSVALPAQAAVAVAGTATILVAEDSAPVGALTRRILERNGYTVLLADSPAGALRIAREYRDPIHLLLSDVVMPEQSGPALAVQIRSLHPEMGVLHMSGYTDDAIVRHGIIDRTTAFIQKPFTPETLLDKVRAVLEGKAGD